MNLEFHSSQAELEGMTMDIKKFIGDLTVRYRKFTEQTPSSSLASPGAVGDVNAAHEGGRKARYEAGHAEGYRAGQEAGHEAGHAEGYEAGRKFGHEAGHAEGYEAGREAGHEAGYERGYEEGYRIGLEAKAPSQSEPPPPEP
jgi:flagellar biosynthesis/type III secretory pathway protein FliH